MDSSPSGGEVTIVVSASVDEIPAVDRGALVGTQLGRYAVLEHVGAGGMGDVYRAYDAKLKREVALKILKTSSSSALGDASARLMREAQAMAQLAHPHVLPVYDVDEADGQLFLAMEFVDGQTVAEWARQQERSCEEILRVFRQAGRGLQAAHNRGLVHRDFKPSNVMVGGDGRARVMDFGLVRLTEDAEPAPASLELGLPDDALATSLTECGSVLGTPFYMAPEQHYGGTVTAKSDQYAFCVALFATLYRSFPYHGEKLGPLIEAKAKSAPTFPKSARTSVPERVRAALAKGLQAKPAARWDDMQALLSELAPTTRRPWRGWVAAGGIAVAGAGVWIAQGSPSDPCAEGRERLAGIWDTERATVLADALVGASTELSTNTTLALDRWASSWATEYADACRQERATPVPGASRLACLERQRQHARALTTELLDAEPSETQGRAATAVESLDTPASCVLAVATPIDPELAKTVAAVDETLAEIRAAAALGADASLVETAEETLERVLELGHPPLEIRAQRARAAALLGRAREQEAADALERAFFLAVAQRDASNASAIAVLLTAVIGEELGRPDDGLTWGEHAEAWLMPGDEETSALLQLQRGRVHYQAGDYERALSDARAAGLALEAAFGRLHTKVQAALNNQGNALLKLQRFDDARARHRDSLQLAREIYGDLHPEIATAQLNLGSGLAESGDLEGARDAMEASVAILTALDEHHPALHRSLGNLGAIAGRKGEVETALSYFERAIANIEANGGHPPHLLNTLPNLAGAQFALKRYGPSLASWTRAAELTEATAVAPTPLLSRFHAFRARCLLELKQPAGATAAWRISLRHAEAADEGNGRLAYLRGELGQTLVDVGEMETGRRNLNAAIELLAKEPDATDQLEGLRARVAAIPG